MKERNLLIEKILSNFQAIKRTIASEGHNMHKDFGITITQTTVLFMLKKKGEMNVTELANILGVSKSAATQLIDGLAKQKYVTREGDESDRRVFQIKLSKKGIKYLAMIRKKAFEKIFTVFEALDENELKQLVNITNKILVQKEESPE